MNKDDHSPLYPNHSARAKTYLEANEVVALQNAATNLRDRLLIRLLSHLGCRITEALTIGVENIDFTNSTISILHLKTRLKLSCPHCGVGISKSHSFCPKCGTSTKSDVEAQPAVQPSPTVVQPSYHKSTGIAAVLSVILAGLGQCLIKGT